MSANGGRPRHKYWDEDSGFILQKLNGKCAALCLQCEKTLKNTAEARLKAHRKVCTFFGDNSEKSDNRNKQVNKRSHSQCEATAGLQEQNVLNKQKRIDSFFILNVNANGNSHDEELIEDEDEIPLKHLQEKLVKNKPNLNDYPVQTEAEFEGNYVNHQESSPSQYTELSSTKTKNVANSLENISTSTLSSTEDIIQEHDCSMNEETATKQENVPKKKLVSNSKKSHSSFPSFVDSMTHRDQEDLNLACAEFFFGCNIPFNVIESSHFKHFIKKLRPAYKIPTRKTLSTKLLDTVYNKQLLNTEKGVSEQSVLLIDGWKNSSKNTKNVVCMIHNANENLVFLDSWDLTGQSETGEALTVVVSEAIELALKMYNTNIYGIVSDNAAPMIKMGKSVDIWHLTCNSHSANLLAKDVVKPELASRVNLVLKEFKHPDLEKQLVDQDGSRIILAGETRWCSYRDAFKCLIRNLPLMRLIAGEGKFKIKQEVVHLLFDEYFKMQVEDGIHLFDPICALINRCQETSCTIADAAEEWLKLKIPDGYPEFEIQLEERKKKCLNAYLLTANFLHPEYRGKRFLNDKEILLLVENFLIDNLTAQGLNDLNLFKSDSGIFAKLFNKSGIAPNTFWNMCQLRHPELANLAKKLMKIPASTAQLERVFSNWSFVHSELRNRLNIDRSKKLLHIYYSLKIMDENKTDQY